MECKNAVVKECMPTACAHGDTVSFRILTESAFMLWRHRLLYDRLSRSFKKFSTHLVPLIKVEGLFAPYIVSIFDIVNSGTLV